MKSTETPAAEPHEPDHALAAAAFGDQPGSRPLPNARSPFERWLRAVALAGQGHYTEAVEHARSLCGQQHPLTLRSLALSLEASVLRQQGDHGRAKDLDQHALSLLSERAVSGEDPQIALARCDALTGLGADHIGLAELGRTRELLNQIPPLLDGAEAAPFGWRARIRWHWVSAETAMAAGAGDDALREAESAVVLARRATGLRHRVKSELVRAAALACCGQPQTAAEAAFLVHDTADMHGLDPLVWASGMLLHAVQPDQGWAGRVAPISARWA